MLSPAWASHDRWRNRKNEVSQLLSCQPADATAARPWKTYRQEQRPKHKDCVRHVRREASGAACTRHGTDMYLCCTHPPGPEAKIGGNSSNYTSSSMPCASQVGRRLRRQIPFEKLALLLQGSMRNALTRKPREFTLLLWVGLGSIHGERVDGSGLRWAMPASWPKAGCIRPHKGA